MRKNTKLSLCLLLIFASLCTIGLYLSKNNTADDPNEEVLSMYGEKIALGEFKFFLNDSVGTVFQYFSEKYGATDSTTFWTTSFQGEIPIEKAKQQTLEKLKVIKAEQVLMKQKGVLEDLSYEAFKARLTEENKRRNAAITKGEVIYGPRQFNEREYFTYFHSNMKIRLQEWYEKNDGQVSDDVLKQTYENWKQTAPNDLKRPDYIQTQLIKVPFGDGSSGSAGKQSLTKAQAKDIALLIHTELGKATSVESAIKPYSANAEIKERVFDESTFRADRSEGEAWIYTEVSKLKKAEHSGLIEGPSYFLIINCLDRKPGAWISFEESKSALKLKYVDGKLQQAIDQLVANASIEIKADVYGRISVR